LITLLVVLNAFPQFSRINADSIRQTLHPGESKYVVETFVGDSVSSRHIIEKSQELGDVEEKYIIRFSAEPIMGNTLKSTANTRILEGEHEQFKKDFSELLSKSGVNQLKSTGSLVQREFKTLLNGVAVTMSPKLVVEVKKLKYVSKVEKDQLVGINDEGSNEAIEVPRVWKELGYTGKGVVIAIVDTGVDTAHVCFTGNKFVKGYDFANNDDNPYDDHFHGTHCAGIAAANSDKIRGVAPNARIMPVKVMNNEGWGRNSDIIAGIEFAVDPDHDPSTNDGAQVLSLSLGGTGYPDDAMSVAIDNAVLHGAVCVVAAGNAGSNNYTIQSPGCSRRALTVGSCSNSGLTSMFSSRGPSQITQAVKPEVSAPGENIYSSIPGNKYENLSGTSMATPHVAGLAALILQKNPTWEPENVKSAIIQSAQKKSGKVLEEGYGMVNAYKALQNDLVIAPYVLDLGVIDDSQGTVLISKEVQIINPSATVKEITFSPGEPINGLLINLSVNNLLLQPGETKTLTISFVIDPKALSNIDLIPMISSEVIVNEGESTYRLPIVSLIGKTIKISFETAPDYCAVFNSDWSSSFNLPVNESELELVVGKNKTDLLATCDGFSRYVLKENIEQSTELVIDAKEAKNQVRFNVQSPEGVPLSLCDGNNEEFRKKGMKYSGFRLMRFIFFMSAQDELPEVKKYFSNISNDYVYENSLSAYPSFNKDIRQIINVPVGLNEGINESRELVVKSSDYEKLKFNLDLGDIHQNIFYTTDNRNSSLVISDPFLKSLHTVNPRSAFEYYMLPLPYDEFAIADGTRFTFWNKMPESYPFDQPILATGYFSLNRNGKFYISDYVSSDRLEVDNSPISLNKNFKAPNILFLSKELLYPTLSLFGKYNEAYTDSVFIKIGTNSEVKSIDTLISGLSYDVLKETKLKNISPNDSVVISTSYPFNDLITTKADFSFKTSTNDNTYFAFPRRISLNGNSVQNRYLLPGDINTISLSTWFKPKIWLRTHGSAEWTEIDLDMTNYVFGPNYCTKPLSGYAGGYYDLKVISVENSGTQSTAQWSPGFYICDEMQADSLCLVELYNHTGGDKWVNHSGWLTERLSNWQGITLKAGRVSEISLVHNNLIGSIPKEITKLSNLIRLDVSGNHLDFIPDLSKLQNLTTLKVQSNKLDFSSIVPNMTISLFDFSSQDSISIGCNRDIVEGELQQFSVNSEFEGNHYQWFKDNQLVSETETSSFTIVPIQMDDAGIYYSQVSNKA
ncbi:MAG TPA: S8 family serine peptidase, partial [Prolixibacteraceae bacterium]